VSCHVQQRFVKDHFVDDVGQCVLIQELEVGVNQAGVKPRENNVREYITDVGVDAETAFCALE
jgi:hypothetical protein